MDWNAQQRERERLTKVYVSLSDDELLRLHETRDDLTGAAQQALADSMAARRLHPEPAGLASDAGPQSAADRSSPEDAISSWKLLHVFSQTFEAQHAFRLLEDAEIPFVVEDRSVDEHGAPRPGPGIQLGLLVAEPDWPDAVALLRRRAGLFPEAVSNSDHSDDPGQSDADAHDLFPVAEIEDPEELAAAKQILRGAGIRFEVTSPDPGDGGNSIIAVAQADIDRALSALEHLLTEDTE